MIGAVRATEDRATGAPPAAGSTVPAPVSSASPIRPAPASSSAAAPPPKDAAPPRRCPADMVLAHGVCVDRWEASMVDKDTGEALSPYYPPHQRLLREVWQAWEIDAPLFGNESARRMPLPELGLWQRTHSFDAKAVSRPAVVPQAYVAFPIAKRACENAGKRLCTRDEWVAACKGEKQTKFPYGETFERNKCNIWGYVHPGVALHQGASFGHRDPRLNLVALGGGREPLLRRTGATPTCRSVWGNDAIYDMVGNVDEWVEGEKPEFDGGFYARSTSNGCEARVTNHAPMYYDYSLGARCCKDPR
ncbi:MAG TPA: SUMF1/EgtB/PvdO family nonheme iron enzyme [Polyangiaceae bacterium]|nr:SUMF1/EgtB/PvdO family nonheme iron enzyme [Polyangiaceae bacterium]